MWLKLFIRLYAVSCVYKIQSKPQHACRKHLPLFHQKFNVQIEKLQQPTSGFIKFSVNKQ